MTTCRAAPAAIRALAPRRAPRSRADAVALERDLRGLWQRRPWRES